MSPPPLQSSASAFGKLRLPSLFHRLLPRWSRSSPEEPRSPFQNIHKCVAALLEVLQLSSCPFEQCPLLVQLMHGSVGGARWKLTGGAQTETRCSKLSTASLSSRDYFFHVSLRRLIETLHFGSVIHKRRSSCRVLFSLLRSPKVGRSFHKRSAIWWRSDRKDDGCFFKEEKYRIKEK